MSSGGCRSFCFFIIVGVKKIVFESFAVVSKMNYFISLCIIFNLFYLTKSCNMTLYKIWLNTLYTGNLATDSSFWRYQTQKEIVLDNNLALQLAVQSCQKGFDDMQQFRAGKNGPVSIQDAYKVMCHSYCLESDRMHQAAMSISGCSCIELSTQPTDPSYKYVGDWCEENSARILCNTLSYCGIWNCRIGDFMCPRYEWNKKYIPLKAHGNCIRGAASPGGFTRTTILISIFATLLLLILVS